jgi:large subunit ribosomal protein L3
MPGILGRKVGMTRIIADDGSVIPVSVIECTPNEVVHVKTAEKDGYPALVLGFDALKKPKKTKKFYEVGEFHLESPSEAKKGDQVTVESFAGVKEVKITGFAKGRGFSGVIRRHHFSSGPSSHGSHHHREPGSAGGARSGTGRVPKGKRYPGHLGTQKVTNWTPLVAIHADKNLLVVKGSIPGAPNGVIRISA